MKSMFKSKTVWVNVLTVAAGLFTFFQDHELVANNPDVVAILGIALGVVNVGLRFLTNKPISVTGKDETNVFE